MIAMHPARLMLRVWIWCWAAFLILPYQLTTNKLSVYGVFVFLLFLMAFFGGTAMVKVPDDRLQPKPMEELDPARAERWLEIASLIAIVAFAIDVQSKSVFDLAASYAVRSAAGDAMLAGEQSNSSLAFQIAFLFYPASYIYVANHIIFRREIRVLRLLFFGFLPGIMVSLSIGGRASLFYTMLVALLARGCRRRYFGPPPPKEKALPSWKRRAIIIAVIMAFAGAGYYFSAVFLVRAEGVGGPAFMFNLAEDNWGVAFHGPGAATLFAFLGDGMTYLLFVFIWYLVQGIVMSNIIFTHYAGPAQVGIYGTDLIGALMRRINPQLVADGYQSLLQLGTYGFLPSAFGSLYVDFYFAGLFFCVLWGYLAAAACRRIRESADARWLLVAPFVVLGILFSVINTPLGFSNGLVTHSWLFIAFKTLRRAPQRETKEEPLVIPDTTAIA